MLQLKQFRKIIILFFLFQITFKLFGLNPQNFTDNKLPKGAKEDLNYFTTSINSDEFDINEFGNPYQLADLSTSFELDSCFINNEKYILLSDEWFYPVIVDSKISSFVFFQKHDDSLICVGSGASFLAENIEYTENEYTIPTKIKRVLLSVYMFCDCWFLLTYDSLSNIYEVYPILNHDSGKKCAYQSYYQHYNSLEDFFNFYKTGRFPTSVKVLHNLNKDGFFPIALYTNPPIEIRIFNLQGQLVFFDKNKNLNQYDNHFESYNLSNPGIYFYYISYSNKVFTGKILLK